jgi:hypoxanthine phosphoribosyltransferase
MGAHLYVSWSDYHDAIERLALAVHDSGWPFNQIVCIARGGLRVGDTLSRLFKLPLAIISTQSYMGEAGNVRGELRIARHMTMTSASLGDRILLVDDLVDSGHTLEVMKEHLLTRCTGIQDLRTAVLYYKACSKCVPDYYVEHLPDSPWIHQPFEPYEQIQVSDLRERIRR